MSKTLRLLGAFVCLLSIPLFAQGVSGTMKQPALPGIDPTSDLVAASAEIANGLVKISFTVAAGTPVEWHHIYLNTDGSGSTGFIHSGNSVGGKGMDFLVEPSFLYAWSGANDQGGWHWTQIQPVQATVSGQTVSYQWPASLLHLTPDAKVNVLIETMTPNYAATIDLLPRNQGVWTIQAQTSATDAAVPAQPSITVAAPSAPNPQARNLFRKIGSYACYYGTGAGALDALAQRDAVIVETRNLTPADVAAIKKKGVL